MRGFRVHLEQMTSKYNSNLIAALRISLDKRLTQYEENTVYRMAAILDPRFKVEWAIDQHEKATLKAELASTASARVDTPHPQEVPVSSPPKK